MNIQGDKDLFTFLSNAPKEFREGEKIKKYQLKNGDYIHCVLWNMHFYITGTDIVKILVWRFQNAGRQLVSLKKFEEGVFSDLRNLKPGIDATLEGPRSDFLEFLYKNGCIRTQKKQKVFFWYSVPHDALFCDALERDLRRETNLYTYSKYMNNLARQNYIPMPTYSNGSSVGGSVGGVGGSVGGSVGSVSSNTFGSNSINSVNSVNSNNSNSSNSNNINNPYSINSNTTSNNPYNSNTLPLTTISSHTKNFIDPRKKKKDSDILEPFRPETPVPFSMPEFNIHDEYTFNELEFTTFDEKFFTPESSNSYSLDLYKKKEDKRNNSDNQDNGYAPPDMIHPIPNSHGKPQK
ncbi:STE-like transcription factor [Hamiltosporidium tvaerminnensis]|uniref:STE-like transcription factor n=2 Tax=Hamiltosporidium tvaerminnensis TaxID=1176355 RepID=A0A4Q9KUB8_9MICR|nr:STE-like transcription factor [Hamiltosporidium tvaerminnensis]